MRNQAVSEEKMRVSFDLDEVLFVSPQTHKTEPELIFPFRLIYPERLRLGVPALFHALNALGYDVWVYTARYYSMDYLRYFFKHYRIRVTGIVTGAARKSAVAEAARKEMQKLFSAKYRSTVHITNDAVTRTLPGSHAFEEFLLESSPETWARDVRAVLEKLEQASPASASESSMLG